MTRIARPDITITASSMIYAQGARLTKTDRAQLTAWADDVERRRIAKGFDAEDARPTHYSAPVIDTHGALIGHMRYAI